MHDYLSNMKQRTGINSCYSSWHKTIMGIPEGSILNHLLFNIFLINLFFIIEDFDISSYSDDNTPYASANIIDGFVKSLEEASTKLFKSSSDNLTKCNADKCHLLVNTNNTVKIREENCTSKSNIIYNISERPVNMNTFLKKSQFSYCCLVWLRHTRAHHIKINRLHKLINWLQVLIYFDESSSFEALLEKWWLFLYSQYKSLTSCFSNV